MLLERMYEDFQPAPLAMPKSISTVFTAAGCNRVVRRAAHSDLH